MVKPLTWKIDAARAELRDIAQDIATAFDVPLPDVMQPEGRTGPEWEVRIDTLEVWTKAGRAELAVDISARFAHLYFRFDDPERAAIFDTCMGRLNRASGKWNHHMTPDSWADQGKPCPATSLNMFRAELRRDFRKVAEPNPCPDDVAAYRAKEAERAASFAAWLDSVRAGT